MPNRTLDEHIEVTPDIAGDKPRIRGHRITVQDVAIWHDRLGKSADEIASEYDLTLGDVHAALAYYLGHRDEIDKRMAETTHSSKPSARRLRRNAHKSSVRSSGSIERIGARVGACEGTR